MEIIWSVVVGIMLSIGIYLLLERHILRMLFGLILISNAINLLIFTAGRLTKANPPFIAKGDIIPAENIANSLPQALILTAIVIGFGLLIFSMVLAYRIHRDTHTADVDLMNLSEDEPL